MDMVRFTPGSTHVFQGYHTEGDNGMVGAYVYVTADTLRQLTDHITNDLLTGDFDRLHNAPEEDWATLAFGVPVSSWSNDGKGVVLAPDGVTPLYRYIFGEPVIVQRWNPLGGKTHERHFGEGNIEIVPNGVWENEETMDGFIGGWSDGNAETDALGLVYHGFVIDPEGWADGRGDAPPIDTEAIVRAREEAEDDDAGQDDGLETHPGINAPYPNQAFAEGVSDVLNANLDDDGPSDELIRRVGLAQEAADEAFWAVVAAHFPEVKSGDFDPMAAHNREQRNLDDIQGWVEGNTLVTEDDEVEGREYVVDVLVPLAIAVRADDEEMAASMALESLMDEGVWERIQNLVDSDDSSFTRSDSPAQTEVGEA